MLGVVESVTTSPAAPRSGPGWNVSADGSLKEGLVARSRRNQQVGPGRAGLERQVDVEGARPGDDRPGGGQDDGPEQRAAKPEVLHSAIVFFCTALPAADTGSRRPPAPVCIGETIKTPVV